jgi:hypothetical protein
MDGECFLSKNPFPTIEATVEKESTPHQFNPYPSKSSCKDGESFLSIIKFGPFFCAFEFLLSMNNSDFTPY